MMHQIHMPLRRLSALARRLRRDTSGVALLEFAFSLPIVAGIGCYAVELSNFALVSLKVNQIALNLADNASRVGASTNLATTQIREVDLNDVLQAARYQGKGISLTTNGRVIVSSLENIQQSYDKTGPVQRIHWQRCVGLKSGTGYDSAYGTTTAAAGTTSAQANAGTAAASGMGDAGYSVNAPNGAGVMFVEVNYLYKPLISGYFLGDKRIHFTASFIVRDNRDFTQIFNPSPAATRATCDTYTS